MTHKLPRFSAAIYWFGFSALMHRDQSVDPCCGDERPFSDSVCFGMNDTSGNDITDTNCVFFFLTGRRPQRVHPVASMWSTKPSVVKQVGLMLQFYTHSVPSCTLGRCCSRRAGWKLCPSLCQCPRPQPGIVDIPHGRLIHTTGYF